MMNLGQISHPFRVPVVPGPANTDQMISQGLFIISKSLIEIVCLPTIKICKLTVTSDVSALTRIVSTGDTGYFETIRSLVRQ